MLTIGRLSLRLPPGFEHRASGIVDMIAAQLATMPLPAAATLDHLRVEHALAAADAADETIARDIARALHGRIWMGERVGPSSGPEGE